MANEILNGKPFNLTRHSVTILKRFNFPRLKRTSLVRYFSRRLITQQSPLFFFFDEIDCRVSENLLLKNRNKSTLKFQRLLADKLSL